MSRTDLDRPNADLNVRAQAGQALVNDLDAEMGYRPVRGHHRQHGVLRQEGVAQQSPDYSAFDATAYSRHTARHARAANALRHSQNPEAQSEEMNRYAQTAQGGATLDLGKIHHHYKHSKQTTGRCLGGVEEALAAAGIPIDRRLMPAHKGKDGEFTHFAKDAGPALVHAGFAPIGRVPLDQVPPGCAVVFGAAPGHPEGHIQLNCATSPRGAPDWRSDNKQDYANPYGLNNYQVYQPAAVTFNDVPEPRHHYAASERHGHRTQTADRHRPQHYAARGPHSPTV